MKSLLTVLILLLSAGLVPNAQAHEPQQETCPVMEGNAIDPSLFVDYEGQRIYFCCRTCVSMFSEQPEMYLPNLNQSEVLHNPVLEPVEKKPSRIVIRMGKLHPLAVHFPIALLITAALAELLFILTGIAFFRNASHYNLLIAFPATALSVAFGLATASGSTFACEYDETFQAHRIASLVTLNMTFLAAVLSIWSRRLTNSKLLFAYRSALFLSAFSVGTTGHFGGLLVHGLNHFS